MLYYYKVAAIGGQFQARHAQFGAYEAREGRISRALRPSLILVKMDVEDSL